MKKNTFSETLFPKRNVLFLIPIITLKCSHTDGENAPENEHNACLQIYVAHLLYRERQRGAHTCSTTRARSHTRQEWEHIFSAPNKCIFGRFVFFLALSVLVSVRSNANVCHVLIKMINEAAIDCRSTHGVAEFQRFFFLLNFYFHRVSCVCVCACVRSHSSL